MKFLSAFAVLGAVASLTACSSIGGGEYGISDYALVRVHRVNVGDGSLTVAPPRPWNRHRAFLSPTFATSKTGLSTDRSSMG